MDKDCDGFVYLPEYGISVRADGAVKTRNKGIHFGCVRGVGYRGIQSRLKTLMVHRLVLEAFCGKSDLEVNHKNGIRDDNRLANLEYCTHEYNCIDRSVRNSAQGCRKTPSGRWRAAIRVDGKEMHIGMFDTEAEAHNAYLQVRNSLVK